MEIKAKQYITGKLSSENVIEVSLRTKCSVTGVVAVNVNGGTERYTGEYEVTPLVTSQVLETKQKLMTDDLKIKEIPFFNVSNTSGGTTVYIGGDIEWQ